MLGDVAHPVWHLMLSARREISIERENKIDGRISSFSRLLH
jgi:hypothetical protein